MNKKELYNKILQLDGLTNEEKSELLGLLRKQKKYGLVWEDKPEDVEERLRNELPVLVEDTSKAIISTDADAPNHILIEGDNLEALTTLAYTHEGKIDVIYIDPPYNTGKADEFKYNDKFVDDEDQFRHSKWLSFINKRLNIAYQLLTDDGLLFISIDDNEIAQLKCLCDSIFNHSAKSSTSNCLGVLVWDLGTGTQAGHFVRAHEYVLAYTKNKNLLPNFSGGEGIIDHSALKKISKKNPPVQYMFKAGTKFLANDGVELTGSWGGSEKTTLVSGKMVAENQMLKYDVTLEAGFAMISQMKSWFDGKDTIDSKGQKVIDFYFNSTGVLHYKKERSIINPPTVIKDTGSTKAGTTELENILGRTETFGYPKPKDLIKYLLSLKSNVHTILDFFAGSGTTLHATMELNKDGGHRKCILVTNNENNICEEVTYERNKRVINGYTTPKGEEVPGPTGNTLRYYRTSFVGRSRTPKNMRQLMNLSTDMLCIKEDLYTEQPKFGGQPTYKNVFRYFDDGRKRMMIIYKEAAVPLLAELIQKTDYEGQMRVYVFSPSEDPWEGTFEEVQDKVQLCALPQAIYNAYRRILPKQNDELIASDDTNATGQENISNGMLNFAEEEDV